jgi:uncharacterized membrane protein
MQIKNIDVNVKSKKPCRKDSFFTSFICHRIPERTFKIRKWYFPVCSRCTGIYLGSFSYFVFAYLVKVEYTILIIFIGFLMIIPTFIDGLTQFIGERKSTNNLRFFTGILGGLGIAILVKSFKYFLLS